MFDFGFGDKLGMVNVWQAYLSANGYDIGDSGIDGIYGNDTRLATKDFQKDSGLAESGHVDSSTWSKAMEDQSPPRIPANFSNALIDWYRITSRMRQSTLWGDYEGRRNHWIQIHGLMIDAFSKPADRETALGRMRTYYGALVTHQFGASHGAPAPGATTVRPEMLSRLDAALSLLAGLNLFDSAIGTVRDQGGFVIRKITGGTGLSNHSFGVAIDLSASRNPFVLRPSAGITGAHFPVDEFVFVTGVDPFGQDITDLLRRSRNLAFAEVMPVVERQTSASETFVRAFSAIPRLVEAFRLAASRVGWPALSDREALDLLGRGDGSSLAALRARVGHAGTWTAMNKAGRQLTVLFDAGQAAADSQVLTEDPGYIARHGWVNLSPALISALICKEGGRLRWIGAGTTRKDAMHFEIYPDEAEALRAA